MFQYDNHPPEERKLKEAKRIGKEISSRLTNEYKPKYDIGAE